MSYSRTDTETHCVLDAHYRFDRGSFSLFLGTTSYWPDNMEMMMTIIQVFSHFAIGDFLMSNIHRKQRSFRCWSLECSPHSTGQGRCYEFLGGQVYLKADLHNFKVLQLHRLVLCWELG